MTHPKLRRRNSVHAYVCVYIYTHTHTCVCECQCVFRLLGWLSRIYVPAKVGHFHSSYGARPLGPRSHKCPTHRLFRW